MTLSSSEAEWVALSEAVKEVIFVTQLLGSMKISVKLLVMVRVDNGGAIFMASNINNKYVNEYVKERVIEISFVKFTENNSNILTKTFDELQEKHSKKLVDKKLDDVSSFENI